MACISGFNMFGVYVYISAFLSFWLSIAFGVLGVGWAATMWPLEKAKKEKSVQTISNWEIKRSKRFKVMYSLLSPPRPRRSGVLRFCVAYAYWSSIKYWISNGHQHQRALSWRELYMHRKLVILLQVHIQPSVYRTTTVMDNLSSNEFSNMARAILSSF